MPTRALVIGLGSPHGDDQLGWRVIDTLRLRNPIPIPLVALRRPLDLLDYLQDVDRLIVVDAVASAGQPGRLYRRQLAGVSETLAGGILGGLESSHGWGLHEAVQLARSLGRLPASIVVIGVELEEYGPGSETSVALDAAVELLAAAVEREVANGCTNGPLSRD